MEDRAIKGLAARSHLAGGERLALSPPCSRSERGGGPRSGGGAPDARAVLPLHPFGVPLPIGFADREETGGAAARLVEGHLHCTLYPCDAAEVMPLLGWERRKGNIAPRRERWAS